MLSCGHFNSFYHFILIVFTGINKSSADSLLRKYIKRTLKCYLSNLNGKRCVVIYPFYL